MSKFEEWLLRNMPKVLVIYLCLVPFMAWGGVTRLVTGRWIP